MCCVTELMPIVFIALGTEEDLRGYLPITGEHAQVGGAKLTLFFSMKPFPEPINPIIPCWLCLIVLIWFVT